MRTSSGRRLGDILKEGRRSFHFRIIYDFFETKITTFLRHLCNVIVSAGYTWIKHKSIIFEHTVNSSVSFDCFMLIAQYMELCLNQTVLKKSCSVNYSWTQSYFSKVLILPEVNANYAIKNNVWIKHFWTKAIKSVMLNTKLIKIKANLQDFVAAKTKLRQLVTAQMLLGSFHVLFVTTYEE